MRPVTTFVVSPTMPPALSPLKELAYNFWWCWHADAVDLFRRMDPALWEEVHHNPVALLSRLPQQRLQQLSERAEYLSALSEVHTAFRKYMDEHGWYATVDPLPSQYIAYFCAEFGLHESFPSYSGGLGVLAGDHLKSSSDLGLPLVGIGLLYQEGYFHQYLTQSGWQNEEYIEQDFFSMPVTVVTHADGSPVIISVDMPQGTCYAQIWRVNVGRVPLYLLDTNVEQNVMPEFRDITDRLYGGTTDSRVMQEMMLGIGGMRALHALGIDPAVCHINEGHAAFSMLERTKQLRERDSLTFDEAWQITRASSVFTTHTPVPAGNEVFDIELLLRYFLNYIPSLGITWDQFLLLGSPNDGSVSTQFSMTILGLRGAAYRNGVSKLHGHVARTMWKNVWPHVGVNEVPIGAVTNGVHTPTWVAPEIADIYDRYLGLQWRTEPHAPEAWANVDSIPSMELWRVHQRCRERLVLGAREHILHKHEVSLTQEQINSINEHLDPDVLTIGYARRFASYKRADLLMRDTERFSRIISNADRPVQIVLAGKAHPRDTEGKDLIASVIQKIRKYELDHRVVFLEDYEMSIARLMVAGCDVWLNTPRRPHEASGTSGMKSVLNGGLHCSILDGWWAEGYDGSNGFAIGRGEMLEPGEQDAADSETLYDLLEHAIIPMYYEMDKSRVPERWVQMMKRSIRTLAPQFSALRMVREYTTTSYLPALKAHRTMTEQGSERARSTVTFHNRIASVWSDVSVHGVVVHGATGAHVGKIIHISANVQLSSLTPDEVVVQAVYGRIDSKGEISPAHTTLLHPVSNDGSTWLYQGEYACEESGRQGCTVRVMPSHPSLVDLTDSHRVAYAHH